MRRLFLTLWITLAWVCSATAHAGELLVSAAASLGPALKEIAQNYEARFPETKVLLNLGASGALVQQLARGAPVDVVVTADTQTMQSAAEQELLADGAPPVMARNALVVIVPATSRLNLSRLQDLTRPEVTRIALGNPASVPAGRYAQRALEAAGQWPAVQAKAIQTLHVRQSLDYVARGEVDAGFVYATDARDAGAKVRTAFAVTLDWPIAYPMALARHSRQAAEGRRFMAHVLSRAGQDVLLRHGFLKP